MREQLLTRMIHLFGFEHEFVIEFAQMCEDPRVTDEDLAFVVRMYEETPELGFEEEEW